MSPADIDINTTLSSRVMGYDYPSSILPWVGTRYWAPTEYIEDALEVMETLNMRRGVTFTLRNDWKGFWEVSALINKYPIFANTHNSLAMAISLTAMEIVPHLDLKGNK